MASNQHFLLLFSPYYYVIQVDTRTVPSGLAVEACKYVLFKHYVLIHILLQSFSLMKLMLFAASASMGTRLQIV